MEDLDLAEREARLLLDNYERSVRTELEAISSQLLPELDAAAAVLGSALSGRPEVRVGFVGESQVGKSSLINALLGRTALPTGGIGPLTAQATRLRYAPSPSLVVRYHSRARINQFIFALRQYLAARGDLNAITDDNETSVDMTDEEATEPAWSSAVVEIEAGKAPAQNLTGEYLLGQARLMMGVENDQISRSAILSAMRSVLGASAQHLPTELASYAARIDEIRNLLGSTASTNTVDDSADAFTSLLHANAAGWRSPLVADLDLALDVELLSRVEIVDLPGVGVVGDPAGKVAEEFVRNDADALIIVARNNGLTDEIVSLLERTGVITRLLFGGQLSRVTPIHIVFAITRLDDVAQDHWKRERAAAKSRNATAPSREEVFSRLAGEMERRTKEQVRHTLEKSTQFDDLSPELRDRRALVVRQLCDSMEVICVSAKDFSNLQDEEDRGLSFLQNEDATNIPHFRERLAELAARARASRRERIVTALESFRDLLESHIDALAAGSSDLSTVSASDAERFRNALSVMVPPLQARAAEQRRDAASFLSDKIPPKLELLTQQAADRAQLQLEKLARKGETLHWATLNAALVRNGTFDRREIDYPGTLTTSFVDVIASSWEHAIVDEVAVVIRKLVADQIDLVGEFLAEASTLSGGDDLLGQIHAQRRVLKQQGKSAVQWTGEQLHDLSEDVRKRLNKIVGKPIEKACVAAVKQGDNRGTGARARILEAFQIGGAEAIGDARDSCLEILSDHFRRLRQSLSRLLRDSEDPISQCYQAVVQEGAELAERAGQAERQRRAAAISRIRNALATEALAPKVEAVPRKGSSVAPTLVSSPSLSPLRGAAAGIFDFQAEGK